MKKHDEYIERLINRKLDGELTADEQLELDRALIRSPEHRALLEQLHYLDAECGDVMRERLAADGGDAGFATLPVRRGTVRRGRASAWWLLPAGLAACFGWVVFGGSFGGSDGDTGLGFLPGAPIAATHPDDSLEVPRSTAVNPEHIRRVGTGEGLTNGRRDTGVYGVVGDDGNVYLIEVDRIRTVRRPAARSRVRVPLSDL